MSSSRPTSSQINLNKNMFSSLPSASKIYVTKKPKPKNIHSAKRKKEKIEIENKVAENSDDTLINQDRQTESDLPPNESTANLGIKLPHDYLKSNKDDNDIVTDNKSNTFLETSNECDIPIVNDDSEFESESNNSFCTEDVIASLIRNDSIQSFENNEYNLLCETNLSDEKSKFDLASEEPLKIPIAGDIKHDSDESALNNLPNSDCIDFSCDITFSIEPTSTELVIRADNSASVSFIREKDINSSGEISILRDSDNNSCYPDIENVIACNNVEENSNLKNSVIDNIEESSVMENAINIDSCSTVDVNDENYNKCLQESNVEKELLSDKLAINGNGSSEDFINNYGNDINIITFPDVINFHSHTITGDDYVCSEEISNTFEIIEANSFENKDTSNQSDNADGAILSQDCSEQNSCTESVICELKDFSCNVSLSNNSLSDLSNQLSLRSKDVISSNNINLNNKSLCCIIPNKPSYILTPKRCMSLPDNLQMVNQDMNRHINIGSAVTLSSDKATLTSDFESVAYNKGFDYSEKEISEVEKKPEKSYYNSVASGDNLPFTDILPQLTMIKARMRSYVFGCKGLKGALLGNEELSRFFPQNKMSVFVGTWNMNGHNPPENIDDFLLPLDVDVLPDIYAIGVQESMQSKSEWELLLQTTLGPSHVLFTSSSLGVLHLAIFIRRDLIWFCSEPEEASIATRVGSMVKTKGAVAVCFMLFGTSLLFVNSHLTAHEQNLVERISDYEKICSGLDLPRLIPLKTGHHSKNVTDRFDCVFWCGDLNFRIIWNRPAVLRFVKEKIKSDLQSCNRLMEHDQLQKAIKEGAVFQDFKEGSINFNPSFKYDVGTNKFDSTKQRVPSYTDRILYRSKESSSVSCLLYNCVPEITTSDHKPVFAVFDVSLKPGRDNVPLAAGIFKRDVYLEALQRRAKFIEVNMNQKQSTICNMM